jgi:two-component sensor histidine kinase/PAS domain-containing protein
MDFHRLLNRQIKEFQVLEEITPANLSKFLLSIDNAYKSYDRNFSIAERSLIESSNELVLANNKLNKLVQTKDLIIEDKSANLKKVAYNLENAERIAGLGNFSLNILNNTLEISTQLIDLLNLSQQNDFETIDDFIILFENSADIKSEINNSIESGERFKIERICLKNDARFFTVEGAILKDLESGISYLICVIQDITSFVISEENNNKIKEFYESILNNIPVDIAVFNKDHKYLFVNPIAVQNPIIREFLIGKDDFDYCKEFNKDISIAQNRRGFFLDVLNKNKNVEFVDESISAEGKVVYRLRRFSPKYKSNNEFLFMIGFGVDITEKMEQELRLKESVEEKQSLLGEIHHRVKNNLALVSGLVELQGSKITDATMKSHLTEIQHRIAAMSLIHEKLYKSSNFSKIDLKDYLHDLIVSLSSFFNKGGKIEVNFDLDQVFVTNKKAIPIALIVNELITNAFKYAFGEKLTGSIDVKLKSNGNEIELLISDSGNGIAKDFDISKSNSLGFKLINIFTKQLKGSFDFFNNSGLTIIIKFKNE